MFDLRIFLKAISCRGSTKTFLNVGITVFIWVGSKNTKEWKSWLARHRWWLYHCDVRGVTSTFCDFFLYSCCCWLMRVLNHTCSFGTARWCSPRIIVFLFTCVVSCVEEYLFVSLNQLFSRPVASFCRWDLLLLCCFLFSLKRFFYVEMDDSEVTAWIMVGCAVRDFLNLLPSFKFDGKYTSCYFFAVGTADFKSSHCMLLFKATCWNYKIVIDAKCSMWSLIVPANGFIFLSILLFFFKFF